MNVIDNILLEWSYRCPDGIVDMNDPKKVKILFEILKPMLKEDIDDDILNALSNKDLPTKEKILTYLQKLDTGENEEDNQKKEIEKLKQQIDGSKSEKQKKAGEIVNIRKTLIDHGLSVPYAHYITSVFLDADKEDELINYFKNPPSLEIKDGNNIKTKPKELLKSDNIVDELYKQLAGSSKTKGVGKEEFFLVVFYDNVIKEKEGDITVDNEKYEVKGVGAMVTPSDIARGSKKDVVVFLKNNFINNLNIDDTQKTEIENMFKKRERWTYTISNLYKNYSDKSDFFKNIREALNKKYPGLNINEQVLEDGKTLATTITKYLINQSKIKEKILFISPEGIMKVYDLNTLLDNIDKEINITGFSDFAPRLTFKDPENDISKQSDESVELPKEKPKEKINIKKEFIETSGTNRQFVSEEWIKNIEKSSLYSSKDKKNILDQFDCTQKYKNFCLLKPDAKIELNPI